MNPNSVIELQIEKPAAGGRMLARADGQVVLVAGAIPGERVRARLDAKRGGVLFATVLEVLDASPDRRPAGDDPGCGGRDYAHIEPARQLSLKAEIVRDTFRRIARQPLTVDLAQHGSPAHGYRMRARLHVQGSRIGFYREGTHALCDPAGTGQLRDDTLGVLAAVSRALDDGALATGQTLELAENRDATERALLLDLGRPSRERADVDLVLRVAGTTGIGVSQEGRPLAAVGQPTVADVFVLRGPDGRQASMRMQRHVHAFFQGNRYLVQPLVERVMTYVPDGPLTDLYAGVGLFGLAHAALARGAVAAVESDPSAVDDLQANAAVFEDRVEVQALPVEAALHRRRLTEGRTVIVDPPRTGLSREAAGALAAGEPRRLVYVSCDVATLARDVGRLTSSGFELVAAEVFDLFPGTSHVETLVVLDPVEPAGNV